MKYKKIFLFIIISFIFISNVCAKEQKMCQYEKTFSQNEVNYNEIYQVYLTLSSSGVSVDKIIYTKSPENIGLCKEKECVGLVEGDGAYELCAKNCSSQTIELTNSKSELTGPICPKSITADGGFTSGFTLKNNGNLKLVSEKNVFTTKVSCGVGEGMVDGIPKKIPELTSLAITIIQIAVPIILILMGSIDLFKGITAGKEDEMKKGQQLFIKRLITGAIIFFVVIVVKFIVSIVSDTNVSNIVSCIDCFTSNNCEEEYK